LLDILFGFVGAKSFAFNHFRASAGCGFARDRPRLALSASGGASRRLSPEPGPLRGGAQPGAEVPYSRAPDHGDVSTGALVAPEFGGAPTHRVVDLVQQVEPGGKQCVAPLKRPHRRFFGMTSPGPHGRRQ